jgi:glutamate-1-semialdehyde 2,1-aminomutase
MHDSNKDWVERAQKVMPGGALGAFALPSGQEVVMTRGSGAKLYDSEGRAYLDYILGSGPMILGHAHPAVVAAVRAQLDSGSQFYTVNEMAVRLAEKILAATGWADRLKFTSSGSEATYFALRLARAATGRDKIVKFEGAYHGHHDYVMMSTTPPSAAPFPAAIPDTAGIPSVLEREVLIAPFNDLAATVELLEKHRAGHCGGHRRTRLPPDRAAAWDFSRGCAQQPKDSASCWCSTRWSRAFAWPTEEAARSMASRRI